MQKRCVCVLYLFMTSLLTTASLIASDNTTGFTGVDVYRNNAHAGAHNLGDRPGDMVRVNMQDGSYLQLHHDGNDFKGDLFDCAGNHVRTLEDTQSYAPTNEWHITTSDMVFATLGGLSFIYLAYAVYAHWKEGENITEKELSTREKVKLGAAIIAATGSACYGVGRIAA